MYGRCAAMPTITIEARRAMPTERVSEDIGRRIIPLWDLQTLQRTMCYIFLELPSRCFHSPERPSLGAFGKVSLLPPQPGTAAAECNIHNHTPVLYLRQPLHRARDCIDDTAIEGGGDDLQRSRMLHECGECLSRCDLHLVGDAPRMSIERPAEDARESE